MPIFQLTGLSGAGKSKISLEVAKKLNLQGYKVEILDGDETRKTIYFQRKIDSKTLNV